MIVNKTKYVIATKAFPLQFTDEDGERIDEISEAYFYSCQANAQDEIDSAFHSPEEFQVLKVEVSYEF